MRGVRILIVQLLDPCPLTRDSVPLEPFLVVVEDTGPGWEARLAIAHGTIPSRMRINDLLEGRDGVTDLGPRAEPVRGGVLRHGGWKVPIDVFRPLFEKAVTP